jgi:hypothetical protein
LGSTRKTWRFREEWEVAGRSEGIVKRNAQVGSERKNSPAGQFGWSSL